jgi:hypothetical protein
MPKPASEKGDQASWGVEEFDRAVGRWRVEHNQVVVPIDELVELLDRRELLRP